MTPNDQPADVAKCELCGESMPPGENMFKYHGYSGPCPKPPLPRTPSEEEILLAKLIDAHRRVCTRENCVLNGGPEHKEAFP